MDDIAVGRLLRLVRMRRNLRLEDLVPGTGLSVPTLARHERGRIAAIASLRRHAGALDIRAEIRLIGRGLDLPRLADEEHASVVAVVAGVQEWMDVPS